MAPVAAVPILGWLSQGGAAAGVAWCRAQRTCTEFVNNQREPQQPGGRRRARARVRAAQRSTGRAARRDTILFGAALAAGWMVTPARALTSMILLFWWQQARFLLHGEKHHRTPTPQ